MALVDIDQLTKLVRERAGDNEPLTLVRTAVEVSRDVATIGDAVVTRFVEDARGAGHSWAEIGEALGVTKQAVHQKFASPTASAAATEGGPPLDRKVFERFTDRASHAMSLAKEEAARLNHGFIGTEHLLLALLRDTDAL